MCGGCESTWGGVDMVGNLWEYIAEWQGHPGWNGALNVMTTDFGEDGYWAGGPDYDSNLDFSNDGSWRARCPAFAGEGDEIGDYYGPAAVRRGGHAVYGYGGVFAQAVGNGPSRPHSSYGTRCCIDR